MAAAYLKAPPLAECFIPPPVVMVQGCTGKLRQTREEADAVTRRRAFGVMIARENRLAPRKHAAPYHCAHCGWWHTSHQRVSEDQRRHWKSER